MKLHTLVGLLRRFSTLARDALGDGAGSVPVDKVSPAAMMESRSEGRGQAEQRTRLT